jgi:hypothetical protein
VDNLVFRVVGSVTVDGEKQEREMFAGPPAGKGAEWALTEAVRQFNALADEGTEHHGVWCYLVRRTEGADGPRTGEGNVEDQDQDSPEQETKGG